MKKTLTVLVTVLALGAGTAAAGDDEHEKCGAEATLCIREMVTKLRQRGWIGIEWDRHEGRPKITHVVAGSPAEAAGVRVGDVVMAFNAISTSEAEEVIWAEMKRSLVPGKVITMSVLRDGAPRNLEVTLIAVPDHIIAQWVGKHVMEHHMAAPADEVAASP
jgi:C-terminal processing protease CtpA/Prc